MKHRLIRLSDRLWYMDLDPASDRPNLGYVLGERSALLFDCGASPAHAEEFLALLREEGLPRPSLAILSHWHWDHALGMATLKECGIPVVAGRKTNDMLQRVSAWEWTEEAMQERLRTGEEILFCDDYIRKEFRGDLASIPHFRTADEVFEGEKDIDLGGVTCRLIPIGGPHSEDSVICYVPEERFVFLADSAGKDLYGTPWDYDPNDQAASDLAMERMPYDPLRLARYRLALEKLDFTRCLKGHAPACSREELMQGLR